MLTFGLLCRHWIKTTAARFRNKIHRYKGGNENYRAQTNAGKKEIKVKKKSRGQNASRTEKILANRHYIFRSVHYERQSDYMGLSVG